LRRTVASVTGIHHLVVEGSRTLAECTTAEKFSWAAKRVTTRAEDIAYCLLGIFDVNMPLICGEGGRAFMRLQEEIKERSDDMSLSYWAEHDTASEMQCTGLLAPSPSCFRQDGHVLQDGHRCLVENMEFTTVPPYAMTNKGLQIHVSLRQLHDGLFLGVLGHDLCLRSADEPSSTYLSIGVLLQQMRGAEMIRVCSHRLFAASVDFSGSHDEDSARTVIVRDNGVNWVRRSWTSSGSFIPI
jgi:hypothetical protein